MLLAQLICDIVNSTLGRDDMFKRFNAFLALLAFSLTSVIGLAFHSDPLYQKELPRLEDYTGGSLVQNEVTVPTPLLDENGALTSPGYCVHNYYEYDSSAIKASKLRIKEWDFYQFSNSRYMVQITVSDIYVGGGYFFALVDMQTGQKYEASSMSLLTMGNCNLEANAEKDHIISVDKKNFKLTIEVANGERRFNFDGYAGDKHITCNVTASQFADHESLTMAVPFEWDDHFYLDQKMNCMPVTGNITLDGETIDFSPEDTFLLLDWGRGVWPYRSSWYWGNGSTVLDDGRTFGFEIGFGFGDLTEFTENTVFISDGDNLVAHKLEHVFIEKDAENWMGEWKFTSNDGRFEMTMTPVYDNYTSNRFVVAGNQCHQVFGKWNGYVILDNGEKIEVRDMMAFCEYSDNLW